MKFPAILAIFLLPLPVVRADVEYEIHTDYGGIATHIDENGRFVCSSISVPKFDQEIRELMASSRHRHTDVMKFLLFLMPEKDKETVSPAMLVSHHEEAFAARAAHPWAEEVPYHLFLHHVLPYFFLDEPREDWRPVLRKRFAPLVAKAGTLREAADIIANNIRDGEKPETPLLLCRAYRAIGIPSRLTARPPENHLQAEFYDPATKQWHPAFREN